MGDRDTHFPEIDASLDKLMASKDNCAGYAAFLVETFRYPEVQEKFLNSFSGHINKLQIDSTIANAVMLVCKVWDRKGDSIPNLTSEICSNFRRIESQRREWRPEWGDELLGANSLKSELALTRQRVNWLLGSRTLQAMRVHRTEAIAHPLSGVSNDREKYVKNFGAFRPVTYWSVVRLLLVSANIIARLQSHWFWEVDLVGDKVRIYRDYSRMYWNSLPIFSDVEERVRL